MENRLKLAEQPPVEVLNSFQIARNGQQVRLVDADGSIYEGQVVDAGLPGNAQSTGQNGAPANGYAASVQSTANMAQQNASVRNYQPPQNAVVSSPADGSGFQGKAANSEAVQNQAPPSASSAFISMDNFQQVAGISGFAFQVSGLNRKLNQNVIVVGSCIAVPLQAGLLSNTANLSNQNMSQVEPNGAVANYQTRQQQSPSEQNNNILENSGANFSNAQNFLNTANSQAVQNILPAGQFWRVTGRVQVGPTNHFDLDAAGVLP